MDSAKIVAFNNLLTGMASFLKTTFKEEPCLDKYEIQISLAIKVNPLLIYSEFKKQVLPYRKQIEDCDEKFLLKELNSLLGGEAGFLDFNKIWHRPENSLAVRARIFQDLKRMIKLTA